MSRAWNGESLVNELSALLGDESPKFKNRVLGWINDVLLEISILHNWSHYLVKGQKILKARQEIHGLEVERPCAPKVEEAAGGELAENERYSVLITFVQDNGVETQDGEPTPFITTTAENKSIRLSEIPTSKEPLVCARKVYLRKGDGHYYLFHTIKDNYTTDFLVDKDTSSKIEPPDYGSINRIKGAPFFEKGPSNYLEYRDTDQLRMLAQGKWTTGNPVYFSPIDSDSLTTYPIPSQNMVLSFYYYRNPARVYNTVESIPDAPISVKQALMAGVIWKGFEYRDRAGQEIKKANYNNAVVDAINRGGRVANIEYSVRDVYGTISGNEVG